MPALKELLSLAGLRKQAAISRSIWQWGQPIAFVYKQQDTELLSPTVPQRSKGCQQLYSHGSESFFSWVLKGATAQDMPWLEPCETLKQRMPQPIIPRSCEIIHMYVFKAPGLWSYFNTAIVNYYICQLNKRL